MNPRILISAAVAAGLVLGVSGAEAASKTLDGKKVKKLSITANGGAQDNDGWTAYDVVATADEGTADQLPAPVKRVEAEACAAPTCASLEFVYQPAKGVKGGLLFTATWTNPASDIDLYVMAVDKKGARTRIGSCGGFGSASEKVYLAPGDLKAGRKYALVMQFFRSLNETATGTVQINVPSTIPNTVDVPGLGDPGVNCTM